MKNKKNSIILGSFKESFSIIKKNKTLFLVLFLLQLLFFSLIFAVNFHYQPKILESVGNVIDYISEQNPTESNILGDDPLMIHRNYKNMMHNLRLLAVWSLLIFIFINGSMFYLISKLVYNQKFNFKICSRNYKQNTKEFFVCQKSKGFLSMLRNSPFSEFLTYLFKFGFVSLVFFLLVFLFSYSGSNASMLSLISGIALFKPVSLIIAFILFYFMYLTFLLLYKVKLKALFKELFNVGVKKAHMMLLTFFIALLIIFILLLLIIFLIEKNIVLLSLIVLLFVLSFVWGKVFLIMVVKKLV